MRKGPTGARSSGSTATTAIQLSDAKCAPPEKNALASATGALAEALAELATCRAQLRVAQDLVATVQSEKAKLIQDIENLNLQLQAAAGARRSPVAAVCRLLI